MRLIEARDIHFLPHLLGNFSAMLTFSPPLILRLRLLITGSRDLSYRRETRSKWISPHWGQSMGSVTSTIEELYKSML